MPNPLDPDRLAALAIATAEMDLEVASSELDSNVRQEIALSQASRVVADTNITALNQVFNSDRIASAHAYGSQQGSVAQVIAIGRTTQARIDADRLTTTASTDAAALLSSARSTADFDVASVRVTAAGMTADASIAAARVVANARIAADMDVADARINAGERRSQVSVASAGRLATAKVIADQTVADANITAANLDPAVYLADRELESVRYRSDRQLASRQYTALAGYSAGVYVVDQGLVGTRHVAQQRLAGTVYSSDKDYQAAIDVANIRKATSIYVADRRLDEAEASLGKELELLDLRIAFIDPKYNVLWFYVDALLVEFLTETTTTAVATPGWMVDLPSLGIDAISVDESAVVSGKIDSYGDARSVVLSDLMGRRLGAYGFLSASRLFNALDDAFVLDKIRDEMSAQRSLNLVASEANGKRKLDVQAAVIQQHGQWQQAILGSMQNRTARVIGSVRELARMVGVINNR